MIRLDITEEDKQILAKTRYNQGHPRTIEKFDALHMKACGLPNELICKLLDISNNTLLSYFKQYNNGGLEEVAKLRFHKPQSELVKHLDLLHEYFEKNPSASISEASAKIEELTGVKRGQTQVRAFMKSMGFECRKVGTVPAKSLTDEKKTSNGYFWSKS